MKPCFVGDEIENTCSDPSESCHEKLGTELRLTRLDGVKVNKHTIIEGRVTLDKRSLLSMKFTYVPQLPPRFYFKTCKQWSKQVVMQGYRLL